VIAFRILGARPELSGASPALVFGVELSTHPQLSLHAVALQVQVSILPARRQYDEGAKRAMTELFGEVARYGQTQRPLLLADLSRTVPGFHGTTVIDLTVPCSYDLDVASAKYLHATRGTAVPLVFLFRGTVFTEGPQGLVVTMLPWDREASFDLPADAWREAMDSLFPGQGWLKLRRDVLDSLLEFKGKQALSSWDAVMQALLQDKVEGMP
jgi:hypothetical protein